MKFVLAAASLCGVAAALSLADVPRISRFAMSTLEAKIDGIFENDLCMVEGNTRGVYLDGYGAVFTTMVNVHTNAPTPFNNFGAKEVQQVHDVKLKQLPVIREKMRQSMLLMASGAALDSVRPVEQVVFDVTLFYYKWEDTHGLPREITMQAEKQKLLDVQAGRVPRTQLEAILKVQEQ